MPLVSTAQQLETEFPKFNTAQLQYFETMIEYNQSLRLQLDPGSTPYAEYQLKYISLKAKEEELRWLIETNAAILKAERDERIYSKPYNIAAARDELESEFREEDFDANTIEQLL